MSVKINVLEASDVKRIKAVKMAPEKNGLTIIGGRNNQGKTSVLDAITWALGGESYRPDAPRREGSSTAPYLRVALDNGLIVERKGKNSDLTVTDPAGVKGGQRILDGFISKLALDLPKFMEASDKEKADTLLRIIGVGDRLAMIEKAEKEIYQERLTVGRIADQKRKYADEQPYFPDVPTDIISASELIREQQEILARNGQREQWKRDYDRILDQVMRQQDLIERLKEDLHTAEEQLKELEKKSIEAEKSPAQLRMESTEELEKNIQGIEELNRKVRANMDKDKALEDAKIYSDQYAELTDALNAKRAEKTELLKNAELPLPGLSVEEGKLTYHGVTWDGMSGSERLKAATAIVRKLNPECGFVLVDKLEQMDSETLREFGEWAEAEGLQVIGTRVSTGDECSIVIEDGYGDNVPEIPEAPTYAWKEGSF